MELKHKLEKIFNNDYPGTDRFIADVIEPIFGNEIEYINDDLAERENYAEKAKNAGIKHIKYIGDLTEKNYNADNIALLDVTLDDSKNIERSRVNIQQLIRSIMDYRQHLMIVFHYEDVTNKQWRFSYAYKGNSLKDTTSAKRYTYVFGYGYRGRTAAERFEVLAKSPRNNEDFEKAFSVAALSDEFFEKYRDIYADFVQYITGKRYVKESNKWIEREISEPNYQYETTFERNDKHVRDYIKKMFGRIVFLYFLQRKGWLDGNRQYMHDLFYTSDKKDDFLDGVLEPLFFEVLNTDKPHRTAEAQAFPGSANIPYLNGGLFARDEIDALNCIFPENLFKQLFDFLDSYNFTIDENDTDDAEIGIDPEMLGRIFENLLEDNKDKGAFYTPKEIVDYMCRQSIIAYLLNGLPERSHSLIRSFVETFDATELNSDQRLYIRKKLQVVKICDPAIGSGAFPMGLVNLLSKLYVAMKSDTDTAKMKRHIMEQNIYGVDIEQGAVDIARLRFWLAMIVEEKEPIPLPNLHFKIMQGNSLLESYNGVDLSDLTKLSKNLKRGESRGFWDTEDSERESLISSLNSYYKTSEHSKRDVLFNDIINNVRRQLYDKGITLPNGVDPSANTDFFLWHTWFSDVFANGGFDIVIANPPYIDSETMTQLGMEEQREYISHNYRYISGNWDIYMAFLERGLELSKGIMCYITPDKWLSKPFGKKFRKECMCGKLSHIVHAGSNVFETATVDAIITLFTQSADVITAYVFNKQKEIEKRGSKIANEIGDPYLIDSLFSPFVNLLNHFDVVANSHIVDFAKCEGACSTGDAYKLVPFISEQGNTSSYRLVNTGTLDKFATQWGQKEIVYLTKELGFRPLTPMVSVGAFEKSFGKAYTTKAKGPKIILKGLNLLDAFVDIQGIYLPGKTTLVINSSELDDLFLLGSILNSSYAIFYIKTKYSSSSYCGGITFTKDMINELPIPPLTPSQKLNLIQLAKKATELRANNPSADILPILNEIDICIFHAWDLNFDEIRIIAPETTISISDYESSNL